MNEWSLDSEYGVLREVLVCRPDNFQWLPTSVISKRTLDSGASFDPKTAAAQHGELVDALEGAGVTCHYVEPDAGLPYQVFTRDSSQMTPLGPMITQMSQPWRRGEYAPVGKFHVGAGSQIWRHVTAGSLEGGDFMFVDESHVLIGSGEERTSTQGAEQVAGWLREEGFEVRIEPIPARYVHLDVVCSIVAPGLAAVCVASASTGLVRWLTERKIEIVEVSADAAMLLGVNVLSLGKDRILSGARAKELNAKLRAHGLEVLDPDLEMFTLGGGGAHCLTQPLRRDLIG
jgi:N-dimethylarginine dimethylaminohydrolase